MTTAYVAFDDELLIVAAGDGAWRASRQLAGSSPRCLAADPAAPSRVYCGTSGAGLWVSEDAGASWRRAGAELARADLTAVAVSPGERSGSRPVVYAGTEPSALYRSEDGGETWRELTAMRALPSQPTWSFPPRPHTSHVRWITPDPVRAGGVYVCIEAGALVRSFDGGETWIDRGPGGPFDTHTLVAHPLAPGRLYSAAGDGLFEPGRGFNVSADFGEHWDHPDDGLERHYLWGVAVDPADPETLVVSAAASPTAAHSAANADSTVYRKAGGAPWREVRNGLPEPVGTTRTVLATNPEEAGIFYAASNGGLFRSADGGLTWQALPLEWPDRYRHQSVSALVVTP